ncbi:MAG: hypothetical protein WBF35_11435 [Candidatus Acidiferrales bacterium]
MGRALVNGESVSYGHFVEGAYAMYLREPTNLKPEPQAGDIPERKARLSAGRRRVLSGAVSIETEATHYWIVLDGV